MATIPEPDRPPFRVLEVVVLTALAAFLRGGMLLSTIDTPGDGPVKALLAHEWASAPRLVLHGVWLPGYLYLTGLVSYFLPMWIALRLFNAIVGTATVPVIFMGVAQAFGPSTGLLAAALVAVLPLHVELSASSLSEASAIFELLLGMALLTMAARSHGRRRAVLTVLPSALLCWRARLGTRCGFCCRCSPATTGCARGIGSWRRRWRRFSSPSRLPGPSATTPMKAMRSWALARPSMTARFEAPMSGFR
jgi:hypothetical protein